MQEIFRRITICVSLFIAPHDIHSCLVAPTPFVLTWEPLFKEAICLLSIWLLDLWVMKTPSWQGLSWCSCRSAAGANSLLFPARSDLFHTFTLCYFSVSHLPLLRLEGDGFQSCSPTDLHVRRDAGLVWEAVTAGEIKRVIRIPKYQLLKPWQEKKAMPNHPVALVTLTLTFT